MPFGPSSVLADVSFSLLYVLAVSSVGVYGILLSGWASNSKYALMGAVRSGAQMVSYEVVLGFCDSRSSKSWQPKFVRHC